MKRFLKVAGACLLIALLTCGGLFVFREPLLKAAAHQWVVDTSPPGNVDAVLIPGGGLETRPFGAAKMFHQDRSARLVTFQVEQFPSEQLGITTPADQLTREILVKLDIPASAITVIGDRVTSTQDEVLASKQWALENGITSLAVMTEIFPSRRVAWAYENGFADTQVSIHVVPLPSKNYTADNWWQDESGLIQFHNELIKFAYYLVRY